MIPVRALRAVLALALLAAAAPLAAQQAQAPAQAAPASPPPTAVAPATAAPTLVPPADAVALCNDRTVVVAPAQPSACSARGGVKVLLPGPRPAPAAPVRAAAPAQVAAPASAVTPPAGATMRCKDGTWLSGTPDAQRCRDKGGLAVILPVQAPPPARPPR